MGLNNNRTYDHGLAFPHNPRPGEGVTVRDWFACQILAAMIARGDKTSWERMAEEAFNFADVVLFRREHYYSQNFIQRGPDPAAKP